MYITPYLIYDHDFGFLHQYDNPDEVKNSRLHYHSDIFELLYFISGNCYYMVDGNHYRLSAGDAVIARPDELHMMVHEAPLTKYERVNIEIPGKFFVHNRCESLKDIFTYRKAGVGNLILKNQLNERNIQYIINDMKKYCDENDKNLDIVMNSKLIELLYNLNKTRVYTNAPSFSHDKIRDIIVYINDNIESDLSLDTISKKFYMSRGHLCALFKEQTGMTLNKYISYKRMLKVQELYSSGMKLIDACANAGFGSYSNFHRMYVKEFGKTPKVDMDEKNKV